MAEPFIAQIVMFGGNFAPRNWALCDGQLLAPSSNDALFSLLGTTFGGNGRTTFGLPEMRGRAGLHAGSGPGLSTYRLGESKGAETSTMTTQTMASHTHGGTATVNVSSTTGTLESPVNNYLAPDASGENSYNAAKTADSFMNAAAVSVTTQPTGSGHSFNNMAPYEVVNYIIALYGIYPSRT